MSQRKVFALCAIVCVSVPGVAPAATWSLFGRVSSAINVDTGAATSGFVPTGAPSLSVTVPHFSGNNQYKLDFYTTMTNQATVDSNGNTVRGFGNIDWSVAATAGLNAFDTGSAFTQGDGWRADGSNIDTNAGSHTSGLAALWAFNLDFGGSATDLQDILQSLAVIATPNTNDPRPYVGKVLPSATVEGDVTGVAGSQQDLWRTTNALTYVGTLFVDWNGSTQDTLTTTFFQASYVIDGSGVNGNLERDKGTPAQGIGTPTFDTLLAFQSVQFTFAGPVPEPATLAMAAVAAPCLLLAIRRRRRKR